MYLTFLRPLALPRAATFTRFLATASKAKAASASAAKATANLKKYTPINQPPSAEAIAALPYRISRTPSKLFPVYLLRKRGGNLHQTRLRKIEGNINVLRKDLQMALLLEEKDIFINQLTRQIIIKVWLYTACEISI